jgi:hypothetical protein
LRNERRKLKEIFALKKMNSKVSKASTYLKKQEKCE